MQQQRDANQRAKEHGTGTTAKYVVCSANGSVNGHQPIYSTKQAATGKNTTFSSNSQQE
jgi:hypothetical protein